MEINEFVWETDAREGRWVWHKAARVVLWQREACAGVGVNLCVRTCMFVGWGREINATRA